MRRVATAKSSAGPALACSPTRPEGERVLWSRMVQPLTMVDENVGILHSITLITRGRATLSPKRSDKLNPAENCEIVRQPSVCIYACDQWRLILFRILRPDLRTSVFILMIFLSLPPEARVPKTQLNLKSQPTQSLRWVDFGMSVNRIDKTTRHSCELLCLSSYQNDYFCIHMLSPYKSRELQESAVLSIEIIRVPVKIPAETARTIGIVNLPSSYLENMASRGQVPAAPLLGYVYASPGGSSVSPMASCSELCSHYAQ